MTPQELRSRLDGLPTRPGVYFFKDAGGALIYVGKAKSLRSRVRSYFQPSAQHTPKTRAMVEEVADLEVIVVDNEFEAIVLEANLIKREHPRYNIILRDDKSFPFLKLSLADTFPRVSLVRRTRDDGHAYFGPFFPASVARRSLKLIPRFFRVATCTEVFDGKRRPCLYYHLDQCLAPCAGKVEADEYRRAVEDTRLFLTGRDRALQRSLERQMKAASAAQAFEQAARLRDTLRTVRQLSVKQRMASVGSEEQDYFAAYRVGSQAALQVFQVREGRVQGRRDFGFDELEPDDAVFYEAVVTQYYATREPPREVYLPVLPTEAETLEDWLTRRRGGRVRLRVPKRGGKLRLLELVTRNAKLSHDGRFRGGHRHGVLALERLAEVLGLDQPPYRIECFDVSNLQGRDSVASLVVWEGGRPKKADYRSFNIKSVAGADDFASIAEAVTRRYRRRIEEQGRLPDLVLIDGGAGQLGAALSARARVGLAMMPIVALAKREEELYLEGGGEPLRLERDDPALQLVQQIRDEAHRFAVARHRRRRRARTLKTELTEIPGIGATRARRLLQAFGSVAGVRRADVDALAQVVGAKAAEAVARHYKNVTSAPD